MNDSNSGGNTCDSLTQNHWHKLKSVFNKIVELPTEERSVYLLKIQSRNETFYNELLELLNVESESQGFLREPIDIKSYGLLSEPLYGELLLGQTVGKYKIVSEIARGGMGTVYEVKCVESQSGVESDKRFAFKLINSLFINNDLLKKFKREQMILATLKHPNIVRLIDAGIFNDRIPYYVMEYVTGVPINLYAGNNNLSLKQRLELFQHVAEAVAYAHRRLIVHRDLKPSNILVTGDGQIKLLDFGIAKILDEDPLLQTQTQNMPLTPAYASPEQIKGETITTTSDVFSLGTILCELLTEKSPHEFYDVPSKDILRGICDLVPRRPSTIIGYSKTKADNDKVESNLFYLLSGKNALKGDLDRIILKALSKEPEERYDSVEQFAEDIEFYLKGLPVKAHPPSFNYRFSKFVRRNRWQAALSLIAILLIAGGTGFSFWQASIAREQRQLAEQQKEIADRRFEQARRAANLVIFNYHDQISKIPGSVKLREEMISDALNYLNTVSAEETSSPDLLIELAAGYRKVGDAQGESYAANLGKHLEALQNYEKSVDLLEKAVSIKNIDTIKAKNELVKSYRALAYAQMRNGNKKEGQKDLTSAVRLQSELNYDDQEKLSNKVLLLELKAELGDTVPDEKNIQASLEIYRAALAEAEPLATIYPDEPEVNSLLAMLTQRVGTACRWAGERNERKGITIGVRDYYRQAVENAYRTIGFRNQIIKLGGNVSLRAIANDQINLAENLLYNGQTKEALFHIKIAEETLQTLGKSDPENRENDLDELNFYNFRMKLMLLRNKNRLKAIQVIEEALIKAEKSSTADPTNTEAISWVGYFAREARELLLKQNKPAESISYDNLYKEYASKFREQSGYEWSGEFGF